MTLTDSIAMLDALGPGVQGSWLALCVVPPTSLWTSTIFSNRSSAYAAGWLAG